MNQIPFKRLSEADLDKVEIERTELVVTRTDHEPLVILPLSELEGLKETLYLLSNPSNARMLLHSITEANAGRLTERELIDP